ncbi:class I SAM-dependent methyltransferase [Chryseobacterium panacisoli]|uniref:Class I SAM-dependent methyltransferase n=1 Tax=Chryseobacterium panacisoli TaxID=1807141 RepID=A0A5D8ZGY5_9FLAO|nr:class I SAM-dependent methyltransferase [Chryseobacterium panacisoli]TZF93756.1 class I SAM-dependent methyltransferase [Chryseobacterium panacisoli]
MQKKEINFIQHNESAWNKQALEQNEWSKAVSSELISDAKQGKWEVHLTPKPLDKAWLGDVKGKKILCLASAGGQQAPILAAAGASVVVFDISEEQLKQDQKVAERDGLPLEIVQGDMRDLSAFEDETFDIVFHPISNHYVEDVNPVWREAYRVLKKGGVLLASFFNPVVFVADRNPQDIKDGIIRPKYTLPYADIKDLSQDQIQRKLENNEALVFGHTLSDLIGGQLKAGFMIEDFTEEMQPNPRFLIDKYLPTFMATKAVKVNL